LTGMTIQEATYFLLNKLKTIYPESEASQVTDWVMESLTGSTKAERMIYKNSDITPKEETQLQEYAERLMKHEPVQYVLNEAWFCGLKFYVDRNVLIPRPETEELVEWIVKEAGSLKSEVRSDGDTIQILDIGTGSGCIPISLKRKLIEADISGVDVSLTALDVARKNSNKLGLDVNFTEVDFLDEQKRSKLPLFDIIVSNPPYVPENDKEEMQPNVLEYEPHLALFVPDNNALRFYEAISEFGKTHLTPGGAIYMELHEKSGSIVADLFRSKGFDTELKKDVQGKNRMLKASARIPAND
jgi:release factor glutamine methyltransferase